MPELKLYFLGAARFVRDGQAVTLSAAKAMALLAYLAVTGSAHTREFLTDLLWPGSLPDAARKNLRNTLWTIRKTLGDDVLHTDADRMALSEAVWVDVRAFETAVEKLNSDELESAVDVYRAPLLDGLAFSDAPDLEIWLTAERERLGQLYLRALEALITAHRATARWSDVIALARRALAFDNLQEPMHRALIEAHARLGERPEALRQYKVLRATLTRELGVEPLPETEALREAILSGNLGPAETPPRPPRRPAVAQRPGLPFVGRRVEFEVLNQELKRAGAGQARVALITGELGIGKSRLWQEWSATMPPGPTVLETRCLDTTQALPFAPLISLFSCHACVERLFEPLSPVPPIWLAELSRLLPEIRQRCPDIPAPPTLPPEEERRRLFEAFIQTLRALEARPLILFVDDLHWVDQATLDWLVYLIDRLRDEPLLLVGAYRTSDAPAQLVHLVTSWSRQGVARRLPLARLTPEESTALVAALDGDTALAGRLHAQSAGNPYFLIELNRAAPDGTPPRLAELVRARLNQLPDATRQVLQAAAVLDADIDFSTLRQTSGRGEEETLDALDALLETNVLVEREGHYQFVHPLMAAVVREDLNLARRSFLHRRAAEALQATHAGQPVLVAGRLANHYAQAGRPALAARYAELAAERALELTATAEAVAFYRQALSLEPTPTRRLGLSRALFLLGELEVARETLRSALAEFEAERDVAGAARACLVLAESYLPAGRGDETIEWAERALLGLDAQREPEILAEAHYLLAAGGGQVGRSLAEAEAHLLKAAALATENDLHEMAAGIQFQIGNLQAQRGDLPQALEAFEHSIALARAADAHFQEILGHNNLAYHALLAGDLDKAWEHVEIGLAMVEESALFLPRQYLYSTQGEIALAQDQLDEAETWFRRALVEAEKYGNQLQAANIRANLGLVAQARGDLDEALVLLKNAHHAASGVTGLHLQTQIDLWLAELYTARGERTAAQEALARAEARLAGRERRLLQERATRIRATL